MGDLENLLLFGHALVSRADLPIEPWVAAWGASLVLIVSFFALAAGWQEPRLEEEGWRPLRGRFWSALTSLPVQILCGLVGIALLGVTVYSGLEGTSAPDRNFAMTFVFVTAWLGIPVLSVLLGDVFSAFNPWRAVARASGWGFARMTGQEPVHLHYPERLGRWPAAAGIVVFVWFEVVYGAGASGVTPHDAAVAILAYSGFTLAMMTLFGAEAWVRRGETFSVYFNMFSQLSALEVREGKVGRRRPLSGASHWGAVPGSAALAVASIGTTSFDGAQEGVLKQPILDTFEAFADGGMSLPTALELTSSIYLVLCVAVIAAVYLLGVRGMRTAGPTKGQANLARSFAHSLIPIAFGYLFAHYFSVFVFQEQAQFTYLLSDPLGTGTTDLFGTASGGIDYAVIGADLIQYVQVGSLLVGHVVGLTLAHDKALVVWGDLQRATRSQYWMLAVMVLFTCFGLYLLTFANQ